jgi:hypothetical protein
MQKAVSWRKIAGIRRHARTSPNVKSRPIGLDLFRRRWCSEKEMHGRDQSRACERKIGISAGGRTNEAHLDKEVLKGGGSVEGRARGRGSVGDGSVGGEDDRVEARVEAWTNASAKGGRVSSADVRSSRRRGKGRNEDEQ